MRSSLLTESQRLSRLVRMILEQKIAKITKSKSRGDHKKSKKGIATPKPELDLVKQRYKEAKELAEHEQDEQ